MALTKRPRGRPRKKKPEPCIPALPMPSTGVFPNSPTPMAWYTKRIDRHNDLQAKLVAANERQAAALEAILAAVRTEAGISHDEGVRIVGGLNLILRRLQKIRLPTKGEEDAPARTGSPGEDQPD